MADSDDGIYLSARSTQELMDSPWIAAPPEDLCTENMKSGYTFHVHVWGGRHYDEAASGGPPEIHRSPDGRSRLPVPHYHFYLFPTCPARRRTRSLHRHRLGPAADLTHDGEGTPSPGLAEVIDIASHELVHTWNVKRLRPAEWMPYDFSMACPSRLGYVAEGVTTYLGDLFLLEAGVIDMEGWLTRFEKLLTRHLWNPGRLETSVADSSVQTWLDGYSIGVPHRRGNIYVEGAVLAFLCDVALNRAGGGWLVDALSELTGPEQPRALTETMWWSKLEKRAGTRAPEGAEEIRRLRADFCGTKKGRPGRRPAAPGVQGPGVPRGCVGPLWRLWKGPRGPNRSQSVLPDARQKAGRRGDVVNSTTEEGLTVVGMRRTPSMSSAASLCLPERAIAAWLAAG